ncbi:MAG: hypothetical protein M1814_003195 [Vezdaea aestivalis]|nr:MAG: hypothetical protein M1814_003195 [Vezdaea aestivalis]
MKLSIALTWLSALGLEARYLAQRPQTPLIPTGVVLNKEVIDLLQQTLYMMNLEYDFFTAGVAEFEDEFTVEDYEVLAFIDEAKKYYVWVLADDLSNAQLQPLKPCKYWNPARNFNEWLTLARILQSIQTDWTVYLTGALAPHLIEYAVGAAARAPEEARWETYFRLRQGSPPVAQTYQTAITAKMAHHLDSQFVIPGSCPEEPPFVSKTPLLNVQKTTLEVGPGFREPTRPIWEWVANEVPQARPGADLYVAFLNQLDSPVYHKLIVTGPGRGYSTRPTSLKGTTYAFVTNDTAAQTADELEKTALAGPDILLGPY